MNNPSTELLARFIVWLEKQPAATTTAGGFVKDAKNVLDGKKTRADKVFAFAAYSCSRSELLGECRRWFLRWAEEDETVDYDAVDAALVMHSPIR